MKLKKLFCLLTTAVIAVSAFAGNAFAYYDGSTSYSDAPRTRIGGFTYILKENVQYGENVKVPYSATVVDIPNVQKVEIPGKITCDGLEFLVTDVDLCGDMVLYPVKPNKYTNVEEVILPDTIYNITEFAYFPQILRVNIPKNTAIGRYYSEGFVDYDYNQKKYIVDRTIYYSDLGSKRVVFDDFTLSDQYGYFSYCNTKLKLSVDPNNPYYSYKNDLLLSKDGKEVYMSFNESTNITIPDGVENLYSLGGYNFYHVKNVNLPDTLKYLGGGWSSITKVTLPNGLEEIGYEAFENSKLTKIVIPDSVKKIGERAFCGSNLKTIKFGKNLTVIGNGAFRACYNLKSVTIPKKVKEIEMSVFRDCKSLKSITIPKKVEKIYSSAFNNCKNIKNVKILSSEVDIWCRAFYNCAKLKSVTINNAEKIDQRAFNNCKKLSKITINNKKKAPKMVRLVYGFRNTKNGLKFVVKNKKIAKQLKKRLKGSKVKNAKILIGKKVIYKNING